MGKPLSEYDNFIHLTIALVILLFSIALADQFACAAAQFIVQAVTLVTLTIAVWSIHSKRSWYRTRLGFIAAIFIIAVLGVFLNEAVYWESLLFKPCWRQ